MRERAQIVLIAAGVVAVALVPITAAYLQLGYHGDVRAGDRTTTVGDARGSIARSLATAAADIPASYAWSDRDAAVETVRTNLSGTLATLRRSRPDGGLFTVSYNETAAATVAAEACPDGPNRRFGTCLARGGVVVQERADETHVVAAAFDLRAVSERRDARVTLVLSPPGRVVRVANASRSRVAAPPDASTIRERAPDTAPGEVAPADSAL